jgi:hypothetical protein
LATLNWLGKGRSFLASIQHVWIQKMTSLRICDKN